MSCFLHTVITSDGAALFRRAIEEEKKIVFVKAVSSLDFDPDRGDLVHKCKSYYNSINGTVSGVSTLGGVSQIAAQFKQAASTVTLKSIAILAKLHGESDSDAIVFCAANDDNSQLMVDMSETPVSFVFNLPISLNSSLVDSFGVIPQSADASACVASGEYDSESHNIYLKNSAGTTLSTIDASAFIVDGMIESVEVSEGYLVITFNTDSGKENISIPISDFFDASKYYTKTEVDEKIAESSKVSQIHIMDDSGTLKCATQENGSGSWSAYTAMANSTKALDSNLSLVFDSNSKLSAVRLTTGASSGMVANFKLLVPISGSYSVIEGMIYANASSTSDYTLSTAITLSNNDLVIANASFTPTQFIATPFITAYLTNQGAAGTNDTYMASSNEYTFYDANGNAIPYDSSKTYTTIACYVYDGSPAYVMLDNQYLNWSTNVLRNRGTNNYYYKVIIQVS